MERVRRLVAFGEEVVLLQNALAIDTVADCTDKHPVKGSCVRRRDLDRCTACEAYVLAGMLLKCLRALETEARTEALNQGVRLDAKGNPLDSLEGPTR